MFEVVNRRTKARTALQLLELVFHWTGREVAGGSRNPFYALLAEMAQTAVMIIVFFAFFSALGMRSSAPIRGDMMMFLASGIMLFMTHTRTVSKVMGADGPTSTMMLHAPMNTAVSIASKAFSSLYLQLMSIAAMLAVYHVFTGKVQIENPLGAISMFLLAWWAGVCVGVLFLSVKFVAPKLAGVLRTIYQRLNMIFSGKMSPANALPLSILPMFTWNPLFHIIDKCRGYVFVNYNSHRADLAYAIYVPLILLLLGLMGEFYSRQSLRVARSS